MFSDPEIAWAAGFFEGEGTITHGAARIVVRVNNTDPEPIHRFDALEVLEMMWPWLSARRRRRALEPAPLDAIHLPVDRD
jgi:hypothetical protein